MSFFDIPDLVKPLTEYTALMLGLAFKHHYGDFIRATFSRHFTICPTLHRLRELPDVCGGAGTCGVCLSDLFDYPCVELLCMHMFHRACLERWFNGRADCPLCRRSPVVWLCLLLECVRKMICFLNFIIQIRMRSERRRSLAQKNRPGTPRLFDSTCGPARERGYFTNLLIKLMKIREWVTMGTRIRLFLKFGSI